MTRPRCAVGVLILLDMDEMPVEIGDQYRDRRAVRMVSVTGVFDCIGRVHARKNNGKVWFFSGR